MHFLRKRLPEREKSFTLIEMVIVLVLVGIVVASGARLVGMSKDARFYTETIRRMELLRNYLVGDERVLQSGRRADFGFFGAGGAFPNPLGQLAFFWPSPDPFVYANDAWGNLFTYTRPVSGTNGSVVSGGSARTNAGTLGDDITLPFRAADFFGNTVYIYFKDVYGTLLFVVDDTAAATSGYHIAEVGFYGNGQTFTLSGNHFTIDPNGFLSISNVRAGQVLINVRPGDSVNLGSTSNWLPFLSSVALGMIETREVVYPRGGFVGGQNVIEIRLPGSVSAAGAPTL